MKKTAILFLCFITAASFAGKKIRLMQKEIAELKLSSDSVKNEIVEIQTAIAEILQKQEKIRQNQNLIKIALDDVSPTRLDETEIQMAYLTEAFRDLFTDVKALQLMPIIQKAQKTAPRPAGFEISKATAALGGDEYALYSRGLDSFRKKFFDESRQIMNELLTRFPNGQYADRANFWTAESYFLQKNYSSALEYYQKTLDFSGSSKEAAAQYKLSICYLLMNENDKAFEEFTKLTQKYPASDYVPRANEVLKRLTVQRNKTAVEE